MNKQRSVKTKAKKAKRVIETYGIKNRNGGFVSWGKHPEIFYKSTARKLCCLGRRKAIKMRITYEEIEEL